MVRPILLKDAIPKKHSNQLSSNFSILDTDPFRKGISWILTQKIGRPVRKYHT